MSGRIDQQRHEYVLELVIDQPARRNAVSIAMLRAIAEALVPDALAGARVVLLRGAGDRAFCAGFDVAALPGSGDPRGLDAATAVSAAAAAIADCGVPVVALLQGACMGAGGELAVAADLRVAADDLQFAMPPVRLGLVYSEHGLERFRRLVGAAATRELFLLAEPVDAVRAAAMGLVQRVVRAVGALDEARAVCARIAAQAPLAVAGTRAVLRRLEARGGIDAADAEEYARLRLAAFMSDDYREGLAAVRERRPPRFEGR